MNRKEVTVFTKVQETSKWDMKVLLHDLDTKQAELSILQSLLTQKEGALQVCVVAQLAVQERNRTLQLHASLSLTLTLWSHLLPDKISRKLIANLICLF